MKRIVKWAIAAVVFAAVAFSPLYFPSRAADPQKDNTRRDQILAELGKATKELEALGPTEQLFDARKRAEIGPKALPILKRILPLIDELGKYETVNKSSRMAFISLLALLDDADAVAELKNFAQSRDPNDAIVGQGLQLLVRWWKAPAGDPERGKVLDDLAALCKANPANAYLPQVTVAMANSGANKDQTQRLVEITNAMTVPVAKKVAELIQGNLKLLSLEGKPLTIEDVRLDGEKFSSEPLKGKVIVVDFWASSFSPCLTDRPRLKKLYEQYHEKGLEIVSISCDPKTAELEKFLKENPQPGWPLLYDRTNPGQHAIVRDYHIAVPTMFIIDRQGVVRSVKARENLEELIPKLLEEKQ